LRKSRAELACTYIIFDFQSIYAKQLYCTLFVARISLEDQEYGCSRSICKQHHVSSLKLFNIQSSYDHIPEHIHTIPTNSV